MCFNRISASNLEIVSRPSTQTGTGFRMISLQWSCITLHLYIPEIKYLLTHTASKHSLYPIAAIAAAVPAELWCFLRTGSRTVIEPFAFLQHRPASSPEGWCLWARTLLPNCQRSCQSVMQLSLNWNESRCATSLCQEPNFQLDIQLIPEFVTVSVHFLWLYF